LSQLRRGTQGTGARAHFIGNIVYDASQNQLILQSDNYIWYPGITANGTITVTYGSTEIAGYGTDFLQSLSIGSNVFLADGRFIGTVSNIGSNTSATVENPIIFKTTVTPAEVQIWEPGQSYVVGDIVFYGNSYFVTSNNFVSGSTFSGINLVNAPVVSNVAFTISADVTKTTTSGNSFTFYSNTGYIRSNLWYNTGNVTATDGLGLFNSNSIQVQFMKQGLIG
jgi:hypothetical protein